MDDKKNTGSYNTGGCNTGSYNTGDCNTGYSNTGNCNTGGMNTGSCNTGSCNTGDWNTGNRNTGNGNTGNRNTGNRNTGNWNTGSMNTGYCNTVSPTEVLVFNKMCSIDLWKSTQKPNWIYFDLNLDLPVWKSLSELSAEDRKKYPNSEVLGGYLMGCVKVEKTSEEKIIEFKESAQKSWNNTTQEDRELTFKLPNFDADIFFEIFGIDVRKKEVKKDLTVEYITVNGKRYKCVDGE